MCLKTECINISYELDDYYVLIMYGSLEFHFMDHKLNAVGVLNAIKVSNLYHLMHMKCYGYMWVGTIKLLKTSESHKP